MAFGLIYDRLMLGRDEDEQLDVRLLLRLPGAAEEQRSKRLAALAEADDVFEIG